MAPFRASRRDRGGGANSIDVLRPSLAAARETAERLRALPEVERVITLDSFVPEDQPKKLESIAQAAKALEPAFRTAVKPAPTDEEHVAALNRGVEALTRAL